VWKKWYRCREMDDKDFGLEKTNKGKEISVKNNLPFKWLFSESSVNARNNN
jgi:hypothetical protein